MWRCTWIETEPNSCVVALWSVCASEGHSKDVLCSHLTHSQCFCCVCIFLCLKIDGIHLSGLYRKFLVFWKAKLKLTCEFIPLEEGFCWALILSLGIHSQFHSRRLWENKIYHECCYISSVTHSAARSLARWSSLSLRLDNNTNIFLCSKTLKVCHQSLPEDLTGWKMRRSTIYLTVGIHWLIHNHQVWYQIISSNHLKTITRSI